MAIYVFAAIIGWPFVLFLLIFSGGGEVDTDLDLEAGVDLDADLDADGTGDLAGSFGGNIADFALSILSFRSVVFLAAFFGATGLALNAIGVGEPIRFLLAAGVGLFVGFLNARLFAFLKRSEGDEINDAQLVGASGTVVIPVSKEQRGRVRITAGGRELYVTAQPFQASREIEMDVGDSVVVVALERGVAQISPLQLED